MTKVGGDASLRASQRLATSPRLLLADCRRISYFGVLQVPNLSACWTLIRLDQWHGVRFCLICGVPASLLS